MKHPARLLALAAIGAVALWTASAPASALTISVGGDRPTVPLPLPLPIGATATVGEGSGAQVGVQAPASTDIDVQAGKSGVDAKATVADTPLLDVHAGPATVPQLPGPLDPVTGSAPIVASPTPGNPASGSAPAPSASPADPRPAVRTDPSDQHTTAPGVRAGDALSVGGATIGSLPSSAREGTPEVTASIAASPHAGYLAALPRVGARLLLWLALAGAVIALRFFVGSATTRATRAS